MLKAALYLPRSTFVPLQNGAHFGSDSYWRQQRRQKDQQISTTTSSSAHPSWMKGFEITKHNQYVRSSISLCKAWLMMGKYVVNLKLWFLMQSSPFWAHACFPCTSRISDSKWTSV